MTGELPTWVAWLNGLSIPALTFFAAAISYYGLRLDYRRRREELFEQRYKLFLDAAEVMYREHTENPKPFTQVDLYSFEFRAEVLFDKSFRREFMKIIINEDAFEYGAVKPRLASLFKKAVL